jgi:hypothetical protein
VLATGHRRFAYRARPVSDVTALLQDLAEQVVAEVTALHGKARTVTELWIRLPAGSTWQVRQEPGRAGPSIGVRGTADQALAFLNAVPGAVGAVGSLGRSFTGWFRRGGNRSALLTEEQVSDLWVTRLAASMRGALPVECKVRVESAEQLERLGTTTSSWTLLNDVLASTVLWRRRRLPWRRDPAIAQWLLHDANYYLVGGGVVVTRSRDASPREASASARELPAAAPQPPAP